MTISISDAQHPDRQMAIAIMEYITDKVGYPDLLDGELWLEVEDYITNIINRK